MTLSSLDVLNKTFSQKMRGYDRQEVDEFLDIVTKDYEEMAQKIKNQDREIKSMAERLSDFTNMKDSLNRSIIIAQETADNVKSQAESNATRIHREASQRAEQTLETSHREARKILRDTYDEARRLVNESDELKRGMRNYYQRVTMLIEGQLASIKSSDWEEILRPSPIYVGDTEEKLREIIEHTNQNFNPIDENGEAIQRQGEKAPETLDSFANALNGTPAPVEVQKNQPMSNFNPDSVGTRQEPRVENFEARLNGHLNNQEHPQVNSNFNSSPQTKEKMNAQHVSAQPINAQTSPEVQFDSQVHAAQEEARMTLEEAKKKVEDSTVKLGGNINFTTNNNKR